MRLRRGRSRLWAVAAGAIGLLGFAAGCASPGTPRAPSLQLPEVVQGLAAVRVGDAVEVRFTVPTQTTDGVAIRSATVSGSLCRQDERTGQCRAVDAKETAGPLGVGNPVVWRDVLPPGLAMGPTRAVMYRVELRSATGRSAGYSDAAYAAAGKAPPAVEQFAAEGVRPGVLLRWRAADSPAELMVRRERLGRGGAAPGRRHEGLGGTDKLSLAKRLGGPGKGAGASGDERDGAVWLKAAAGGRGVPEMVDGTVEEGVGYRYVAVRSETVRVGGRALEVRSTPSAAAEIVWGDVYPPAAPQGLTAVGYAPSEKGNSPGYAVDLIWEPVNDPRVTGYTVKRQRVDAAGNALGDVEKLTPETVATPGFHDASAIAGQSYRYEVMAVDAKGNVSPPAIATVR